jgi:signal transduction histidine kinase
MKLLTRVSRYYVILSILFFMVGGFALSFILKGVFYRQIDENLVTDKLLIEETINTADTLPDFTSVFGHFIVVTPAGKPPKPKEYIHDTAIYDPSPRDFSHYRHMFISYKAQNGKGYFIHIYKPLAETRRLLTGILVATIIVFLILLLILVAVNYFVARRAWVPFYRTLQKLQRYEIRQDRPLELRPSNIHEFEELNKALDKMSKKIRHDFLALKQFNENAAHELQTPLAVIKSKLDLLIQQENLTAEQVDLVSTVFDAISRMSRLSQGLLLLSKIDNNQFSQEEEVDLGSVADRILGHLGEFIEHGELSVTRDYKTPLILKMDPTLADILMNNLLSNAIRHNIPGGSIHVMTDGRCFELRNTGLPPGVEPEELFERFRKGGRRTDSIGLGLAIAKKITDFYGLKIEYRYQESFHILKIC